MVDLSSKLCNHQDGCSTGANFGLPGGPRTRCSVRKDAGMVHRPSRPQAGSSPPNGPAGPSPDPVREPRAARLATMVSGTGGGGTSAGTSDGTSGGTGSGCKGGGRGGRSAMAVRDVPALLLGGSSMPAASPGGQLPSAGPANSPSAADATPGIDRRLRRAAGERPRQDAPIPALALSRQQRACDKGGSRKRPRGVEAPILPQQAVSAGPSVEGPSGVPASGVESVPLAGAASDLGGQLVDPVFGRQGLRQSAPPQLKGRRRSRLVHLLRSILHTCCWRGVPIKGVGSL